MHNRFRRASYALAAGVAVTATIGLSAVSASAGTAAHKPHSKTGAVIDATNACGAACTNFGFFNPGFSAILGVHNGHPVPNNTVRLLQGSNGASKEDFSEIDVGTVDPLYCDGLGHAEPGSLFTNRQCHLLDTSGLGADVTFQLAFNPNNGGPEDLCVGAFDNENPASGFKLRLEPCGVAADTVLIEAATLPVGTTTAGFWLINGGSDNFSNPLVATSSGRFPSQPRWETVRVNGGLGVDTQEMFSFAGPF